MHGWKMLAKPRYKNPAQVLSLDEHETYPTPPAPEGSRSPFKHYPTPKVYAKVVTLIYPAETGKEGWQCNTQANRRGAGARAARKAAGCYTARLRTMSLAIPSCTSTAPAVVPRCRASRRFHRRHLVSSHFDFTSPVIADMRVTEGWAAPPHLGGISPVGVALDIATIGPPSYHLGLQLALDDTVNTLVSRTARATASPVRDDNLDTDSVCFCPAAATAAAAAEGVATAVHSDRHVRRRVQGHTLAAVLRLPRPPLNATSEGRLAAHRARARHVRFRHGVDGCVARTV